MFEQKHLLPCDTKSSNLRKRPPVITITNPMVALEATRDFKKGQICMMIAHQETQRNPRIPLNGIKGFLAC